MQPETSPTPAAQPINQALDQLARQTPALKEVIEAFRPLKGAQAEIKAGLPALDQPLPAVDPARLAQGAPLAGVEDFLSCQGLDLPAYLRQAAGPLLPALKKGFPALAADLAALGAILEKGELDAEACLKALLGGDQDGLERLAKQAGLAPAAMGFILLQLAKPLLERRAQALATLLTGQDWRQGSCPVCGSLPEMAYLQGEGGQRWLRCSLCAHHWRFSRTACPVCANDGQDQLEFFYAEGRENQRVDLCRRCGKYLVTLDARGQDAPPVWEVAALGLVHLDLLAQEKGLSPASWCAWNQVK
ncbi:MAG: formate dehydrogenase accessory protein FdhE [Desulfarculus sp.]|nr:formate dehydrogenase accessory protein FdhE [Desulfarculus sp.]